MLLRSHVRAFLPSVAVRRLGAALALAVGLTGGFAHAQEAEIPVSPDPATTDVLPAGDQPGQLPLTDLRIFADVFNQIRTAYVEEVDDRTLLENAIKGMLNGLDPHSA